MASSKAKTPRAAAARGRDSFSITRTIRGRYPNLPFCAMKEAVLPKGYTLTLVFVDRSRSRQLNARYRRKNKPANVLSFPYSASDGEIFLSPAIARKEARAYGYAYPAYCARLFIHGLFHLKGYAHGSTMEEREREVRKKFGIA